MTAGTIDDRSGRGYPLPNPENRLRVDVARIADAIDAIDGDVTEALRPAGEGEVGRVALATAGDLQEGKAGPVPDAATVKTHLTALFGSLLDGVSEDGNTLAKLLHLIETIDVSGPLNATKAEIIGDAPEGRQTLGDVNDAADWAQAQADAGLAAAIDADSDAAKA